MAVTITNNISVTKIDPFADGAEVRKVANGFIVMPLRNRDCGYVNDINEYHVFRDSTEMAAWLRKRYPGKAA